MVTIVLLHLKGNGLCPPLSCCAPHPTHEPVISAGSPSQEQRLHMGHADFSNFILTYG